MAPGPYNRHATNAPNPKTVGPVRLRKTEKLKRSTLDPIAVNFKFPGLAKFKSTNKSFHL